LVACVGGQPNNQAGAETEFIVDLTSAMVRLALAAKSVKRFAALCTKSYAVRLQGTTRGRLLSQAARNGHADRVKLLLAHGARTARYSKGKRRGVTAKSDCNYRDQGIRPVPLPNFSDGEQP